VSHTTVQRDLDTNVPKTESKTLPIKAEENFLGTNVPPPAVISQSGEQVAKLADKAANKKFAEPFTSFQLGEKSQDVLFLVFLRPGRSPRTSRSSRWHAGQSEADVVQRVRNILHGSWSVLPPAR